VWGEGGVVKDSTFVGDINCFGLELYLELPVFHVVDVLRFEEG
jgi:hypothetical protein